uniref:Uncharacterized protein n=1 Tax=viral metagenome TaxID=1070528 RepID=A0A6C0BLS1_9ZZZZ
METQKPTPTPTPIPQECPNADYCLSYGIKTQEITQLFHHYQDFSLVTQITPIGQPSQNGFIRLLTYHLPIGSKQSYYSTAILKSIKPLQTADNLYYEYFVGQFVNYLATLFPFFVHTYNLVSYQDLDAHTTMANMTGKTQSDLGGKIGQWLNKHLQIIPFQQVKSHFPEACSNDVRLALLIETVKQPLTLTEIINVRNTPETLQRANNFVNFDLMSICLLIYGTLATTCQQFTHYDLHPNNILLIRCNDPHGFFEYNLHLYDPMTDEENRTITVYSQYLPKIIDYGRCYYHLDESRNSDQFREDLCQICQDCGRKSGFRTFNSTPSSETHYISPHRMNISHDLRLIKIISTWLKMNVPLMQSIADQLVYQDQYGTPERSTFGRSSQIMNVIDMSTKLISYFDNPQYKKIYFPQFPNNYSRYGSFDIHLTMEKPIAYIAHDFNRVGIIPSDS